MKILITGASGFIGNNIYEEFLKFGDIEIIRTTRNKYEQKIKYLDMNNLKLDLNYFDYFEKPDIVIHCAWENVKNINDISHMDIHLINHMNFLKNLIKNGAKNIVVCGSCFEYGDLYGEVSENQVNPNTSYSLSKNFLRLYLKELQKENNFIFKWLRFFYVYDENGDKGSNIFTQLKNSVKNGLTVFNMSKGDQILDFVEVKYLASIVCKISLQNEVNGEINCCTGYGTTLSFMIEECLNKWESKILLNKGFYEYRSFESRFLWGNKDKLNKAISSYENIKSVGR